MNKKYSILDLSKLGCGENDVKGNSEWKKKSSNKIIMNNLIAMEEMNSANVYYIS